MKAIVEFHPNDGLSEVEEQLFVSTFANAISMLGMDAPSRNVGPHTYIIGTDPGPATHGLEGIDTDTAAIIWKVTNGRLQRLVAEEKEVKG